MIELFSRKVVRDASLLSSKVLVKIGCLLSGVVAHDFVVNVCGALRSLLGRGVRFHNNNTDNIFTSENAIWRFNFSN